MFRTIKINNLNMKSIKLEVKKFSDKILSMKGISKKTVEEHLKLYTGYINKYNEIQEKLVALKDDDYAKANQVFSNIRELKVELSFAWGGVINHEIYFSHLGGKGGKPSGKLLKQISARGWVWTGFNYREGRLVNYLGDSQNTYSMWGVEPLVALDTYEHAYFIDYGVNRAGYIDSFFENLDWKIIEENFQDIAGCCGEDCQC